MSDWSLSRLQTRKRPYFGVRKPEKSTKKTSSNLSGVFMNQCRVCIKTDTSEVCIPVTGNAAQLIFASIAVIVCVAIVANASGSV